MRIKITLILLCAILLAGLGFMLFKSSKTLIIQGEAETRTIDLATKINGRVLSINVKEGDFVKKGQVLVVLDAPDISAKNEQAAAALELAVAGSQKVHHGTRYEQVNMAQSQMQQAQAGYDLSLKTLERMQKLHAEGVISGQKFDEVKAQHQSAQMALKTAQSAHQLALNGAQQEDKLSALANIKKARGALDETNSYLKENKITAPIDGEVTQINVEAGELVGSGYPLITITDLNDIWFTFNMREDLLEKIKIGTKCALSVPALGKDNLEVQFSYISPLGNFATHRATRAKGDFDLKTFEVRAYPTSKVDGLRAGMSALFDLEKL